MEAFNGPVFAQEDDQVCPSHNRKGAFRGPYFAAPKASFPRCGSKIPLYHTLPLNTTF